MKSISTLICLLVLTCSVLADHKARSRSAWAWATSQPVQQPTAWKVEKPELATTTPASTGSNDALAEVNEYRAKRGLPPFQHDPLLTQAALKAAQQRANRGIAGHLPESDFTCLPPGASADAAGCGALEDSWGWGTCCADDNYSHAGAAWVRGADGRRYMHLFVRHGQQATTTKPTIIEPLQATGEVLTCTGGSCGTVQQYRRLSRRSRR